MSLREFLESIGLAAFEEALLEVTGLTPTLHDFALYVEEDDLAEILQPPHSMRRPQLRKLWGSLQAVKAKQQLTQVSGPALVDAPKAKDELVSHPTADCKHEAAAASERYQHFPRGPELGRTQSTEATEATAAVDELKGSSDSPSRHRATEMRKRQFSKQQKLGVRRLAESRAPPWRPELAPAQAAPAASATRRELQAKSRKTRKKSRQKKSRRKRMSMKAVVTLARIVGLTEPNLSTHGDLKTAGGRCSLFTKLGQVYHKKFGQPLAVAFGKQPMSALARLQGKAFERVPARVVPPELAGCESGTPAPPQKTAIVPKATEFTDAEAEGRRRRWEKFARFLSQQGLGASAPPENGTGPQPKRYRLAQGAAPGGSSAGVSRSGEARSRDDEEDDDAWGVWQAEARPSCETSLEVSSHPSEASSCASTRGQEHASDSTDGSSTASPLVTLDPSAASASQLALEAERLLAPLLEAGDAAGEGTSRAS